MGVKMNSSCRINSRGQITIFIIVAILIVLGIILVMIGGVLIVNSGNSSGRISYGKVNVSRNLGKNFKVKRR